MTSSLDAEVSCCLPGNIFSPEKKKDIKLQSSALNNITCHPLNQESLNQDDSESEKSLAQIP